MGWSAAYRKRHTNPADTVDTVDTVNTTAPAAMPGPHSVNRVNGVTALETHIGGDGAASSPPHHVNRVTPGEWRESDGPHIAAEPLLPDPGTPERSRMELQQAQILAGLLAGFHNHRKAPP